MPRRSTTRPTSTRGGRQKAKKKLETNKQPVTKKASKAGQAKTVAKSDPQKAQRSVEKKAVTKTVSQTTKVKDKHERVLVNAKQGEVETATYQNKGVLKMTNQNKWMDDMMNVARMSLEAGNRGLEVWQSQAKRNVEFAVQSADNMKTEARNTLDIWMSNANKARKIYMDAVNEGIKTWEEQLHPPTK